MPARRFLVAALAVVLAIVGCTGLPPPDAPQPPAAPTEIPGAHLLAKGLVNGRVEALLHFDNFPNYAAKRYLADLYGWSGPCEAIGVDPVKDVVRAYVTARSSTTSSKVIVLEHRADPDAVRRAIGPAPIQLLADRKPAPGEAEDSEHPAPVRRSQDFRPPKKSPWRFADIEDTRYVLAMPQDRLLVFVPRPHAHEADAFAEVGGLPPAKKQEAALYAATDPRDSVNSGPSWPAGLQRAFAVLVFDAQGGAHLRFEGKARSSSEAPKVARELQRMIDRAMTFEVPVLGKLNLFQPPKTIAEGDTVLAGAYFNNDEFEWIVGVGTWLLDVDLGRDKKKKRN